MSYWKRFLPRCCLILSARSVCSLSPISHCLLQNEPHFSPNLFSSDDPWLQNHRHLQLRGTPPATCRLVAFHNTALATSDYDISESQMFPWGEVWKMLLTESALVNANFCIIFVKKVWAVLGSRGQNHLSCVPISTAVRREQVLWCTWNSIYPWSRWWLCLGLHYDNFVFFWTLADRKQMNFRCWPGQLSGVQKVPSFSECSKVITCLLF